MNKLLACFVAGTLLGAAFTLPAFAQTTDSVRAALVKRYPDLRIESVKRTDYAGLFEVVLDGPAGKEIIYTNEKAAFVMVGGQIVDDKKENITEKRMRQLTAVKWNELPLNMAIKQVRGDGSRNVAVVADPFCGYCKRFEADLLKVDNVTVYTFLLPIIRPESMPISKKVWCANDRAKAWQDLMVRDTQPGGDGACETPIDKVLAFGQRYKINGTPTLVFENGERVAAALTTTQIDEALTRAEKK